MSRDTTFFSKKGNVDINRILLTVAAFPNLLANPCIGGSKLRHPSLGLSNPEIIRISIGTDEHLK